MPLIKNNQIVDDPWITIGEEDPMPSLEGDGASHVILPFHRWNEDRTSLRGRNCCLGIRLTSDQPPKLIENDLDSFDVIALEFPAFKDGRAFSYARILRDRYNYKGEIRAVGEVLYDQWYFMDRCGFDAFEVDDEKDVMTWHNAMNEFSVPYQPASDHRKNIFSLRQNKKAAE